MIWVIDIDGTITANPSFFSFLTYILKQKYNKNDNYIYILTCRNPSREQETKEELFRNNIYYDQLVTMSEKDKRTNFDLAEWKIRQIEIIRPDIWFDNDIKNYDKDLRLNFKERTNFVHKVMV